MVIAKTKPLEEIFGMIRSCRSLLIVGCAGCTALCLEGGPREVDGLKDRLGALCKEEGSPCRMEGITLERQCEMEFIEELDAIEGDYEAILSLACGAGVQFVAERYPRKPVLPALNTTFIGVNRAVGLYEERCRSCGDCQLASTGGICFVTLCAKSLFNGPCGGSHNGRCEVDPEIPCAWCAIYERLKGQGRLESLLTLRPPMAWKNGVRGLQVHEDFKDRYGR